MSADRRVLLSWSSGKDSAWALHRLRETGENVVGLLTTLNGTFDRVAMHAVRSELLRMQASATGLPLLDVPLPWPCSNEAYEDAMQAALRRATEEMGVTHVAFGDLFLTEVRRYREERMAGTGMGTLFPLWDEPTADLACRMLEGGLRARLTCVDPRHLPASFAGRDYDAALLADLPPGVDPCGENGEFHTFTWAGPMFAEPLRIRCGEVVARDGFVFADVLPEG